MHSTKEPRVLFDSKAWKQGRRDRVRDHQQTEREAGGDAEDRRLPRVAEKREDDRAGPVVRDGRQRHQPNRRSPAERGKRHAGVAEIRDTGQFESKRQHGDERHERKRPEKHVCTRREDAADDDGARSQGSRQSVAGEPRAEDRDTIGRRRGRTTRARCRSRVRQLRARSAARRTRAPRTAPRRPTQQRAGRAPRAVRERAPPSRMRSKLRLA